MYKFILYTRETFSLS